ncbi:DUF3237 family protein [Micromonospora sp. RL09-050-HVF-A]|uniref:DUF3237 family protein n=1 Tax=Micromonospora sp. RL09-050-HVF-A TaxID=1703433 RepID=UPI0021030B0C|nr:DUF3237 family protein [Micromonospora sp. RL09-050-HVF-A]
MRLVHRRPLLAGALAAATLVGVVGVATSASAATGCRVTYTVSSQWNGGFGANVAVTNLGDPLNGWQLTWSFTAGQQITQYWNGTVTQNGGRVTVGNTTWNAALGTGASTSFGFNGSWNNASNPAPTDFALNGTPCTGSTTPPTTPNTPTPGTPPPTPSTTPSGAEATIVPDPSWTCGRSAGLVPPTRGRLVFRATAQLGAIRDVGVTQYGHRRILDIRGGTITGDRINGTILTGGLDLELTLGTGATELEQVAILRTGDGTPIYLRTCGVAPAGESTVRIVPDFEAPNSSAYAWLNTGTYVGTRTVDTATNTLTLAVYDVAGVSPADPRVQLRDPAGTANQSWDCLTGSGTRGSAVFTETVTLGASVSVGASKRGTRNIIPITGGTMTGRVTGTVLPGGADYQLIGATSTLDARYVLSTNDRELILVRNCGAFGRLVPTFEARAAGPYAFLNANTWLSSDPGSAPGGVSITFYERR